MHLLKHTYLLKVLKVVFPLTILIILYIEAKKQIQSINFSLVFYKIQEIGIISFLWLSILGILAVSTMILYDIIVVHNLKLTIPKKRIILFGFSANSYANFLGFGGFAGVGLRTIFYRKHVDKIPALLKNVTIILPYMLMGLSFFAWIVLFYEWNSPILLNEYKILKLPLLIMCAYGMFILTAGYVTKGLTNRSQIILSGISILEWIIAAFLFWQITKFLEMNVPVMAVFVLFFMAAIAGVLSTVPGGIGAFDFVVLMGFSFFGVSEEKLVALLLLYRLVYYVVPFLISTIVLGNFLYKEKAWQSLLPDRKTWTVLCHRVLSIWVLMVGVLLLLFPVIPAIVQRLKIADRFLSMEMMQLSQQFSITVGITMLVLARAIEDRVKRAYYFTFFILLFGTVVSFSKGFHFWEAFLLLVAMLLLFFSKEHFYRKSSQYTLGKGIIDGFILLSISLLYVLVGSLQISYLQRIVPRRLQDLIALHPQQLFHDVGVGLVVAVILIYFGLFFRKRINSTLVFKPVDKVESNVFSKLFSKKTLYKYTSENGSILYQKWMDNLIVLKQVESYHDHIESYIFLCKELEKEIDKYGYVLIVPNLKDQEYLGFKEAGFQILREEEKYFALSQAIPQIVAKWNVKWLVRLYNKVAS